ncbi:MAG: hypothetical protein EAZ27_13140 [Cytophagales bacterium]|nr:MAG: hypothetical protein EAZ27_13140 [Cytophagales bacterium]
MNFIKNHTKELLIFSVIFFTLRIISIICKVYTHDTAWLTQTFDISLMYEGLIKNVIYDLYQAPLLNLSVGLYVKIFGSHWQNAIAISFTILSFIFVIETYYILIKIEVKKRIAFYSVLLLLALNPALLYYERYVIYHTPVAFLLINAVLFFYLFLQNKKTKYLFITYLSLSIIVCYRTSFTLYWFLGITAILFWLEKNPLKNLKAFAFPLALILSFYIKNFIIFGQFTSLNMIGNNLASFTSYVSKQTKDMAIYEKKVSKFYEIGVWNNDLENFKPYLKTKEIPEKFKNIGVLNYPTSGTQISHHHFYKHEILSELYQDGKYLIFEEPICLLKSFVWGVYVYFMPQGDYVAHIGNLQRIYWWNRIYNIFITGQLDPYRKDESAFIPMYNSPNGEVTIKEMFTSMNFGKISWFAFLSHILIIIFFINFVTKLIKQKLILSDCDKTLFLVFIFWAYSAALYLILGSFENNRLRFELIALEVVLVGLSINNFKNKILWR